MPASENFAGNQDNWGASAENWSTANPGAGGGAAAETSDWSAPAAVSTTTSAW